MADEITADPAVQETPTAPQEDQAQEPANEAEAHKSLLAEAELPTEEQAKEAGEPKAEEEPKEVVPDKFELKAKEGQQLDEVLAETVSDLGKEFGLTNEKAQKLYDKFQQERAEHADAVAAVQREANEKQLKEWRKEIQAWPDYKEKVVMAKRAVDTMPNEVKEIVNGAFGDWPPLVEWLSEVAARMGEHKVHQGGGGTPTPKSPGERMYPEMVNK